VVVLQHRGSGEGPTTPHRKKTATYEMVHGVSELAGSSERGSGPSGL
jgi:hypothetical protein